MLWISLSISRPHMRMHRNQGVYVWVRIDPMNNFCVLQKIRPDCAQVLLEGTRAEWRPVGATAELSIGVRYAQDAVGNPPRSNDARSFFLSVIASRSLPWSGGSARMLLRGGGAWQKRLTRATSIFAV